jgi:hypothetical protein
VSARFLSSVDDFLRGRDRFAPGAPPAARVGHLVCMIAVFGALYGAVMASLTGAAPGRWHHLLYVAVKVPMLLLVTTGLCLPSFCVVNTVAGLREDLTEAVHAVIAGQACLTLALASLAPVTAFFYVCSTDYSLAVLFNAGVFTVACLAAQVVMRRYYGPLIGRRRRHRALLYFWFFVYAFVGIEMGWVLRPFIGDPRIPVAFFRADAWGNAYEVVARLISRFVQEAFAW